MSKNATLKFSSGINGINNVSESTKVICEGTIENTSGAKTTLVNNYAFFNYQNSNIFASGKGNIIDTGLNVKRPINAKKLCTIDLGEVSYPWQLADGTSLGNSNEMGFLTFTNKSLKVDTQEIKTVYDFAIKVNRICDDALETVSTSDNDFDGISLYPNIIQNGQRITLKNLSNITGKSNISLLDLDGKIIWIKSLELLQGGSTLEISANHGLKLLRIQKEDQVKVFKIIVE